MRFLVKICCLLCILTAFLSCDSRQSAIDDLSTLVEDIRVNGKDYTAEQWADAVAIYEQVIEELDEHEFTREEKEQISKLKGEYMAALAEWQVEEKFGVVKDLFNQFSGAGKSIIDGLAGSGDKEDE